MFRLGGTGCMPLIADSYKYLDRYTPVACFGRKAPVEALKWSWQKEIT